MFQELEEAEIEIDLLQKEKAQQEVSRGSQEETFVTSNMSCKYLELLFGILILCFNLLYSCYFLLMLGAEDGSRLCKIKDEIQSL